MGGAPRGPLTTQRRVWVDTALQWLPATGVPQIPPWGSDVAQRQPPSTGAGGWAGSSPSGFAGSELFSLSPVSVLTVPDFRNINKLDIVFSAMWSWFSCWVLLCWGRHQHASPRELGPCDFEGTRPWEDLQLEWGKPLPTVLSLSPSDKRRGSQQRAGTSWGHYLSSLEIRNQVSEVPSHAHYHVPNSRCGSERGTRPPGAQEKFC